MKKITVEIPDEMYASIQEVVGEYDIRDDGYFMYICADWFLATIMPFLHTALPYTPLQPSVIKPAPLTPATDTPKLLTPKDLIHALNRAYDDHKKNTPKEEQ